MGVRPPIRPFGPPRPTPMRSNPFTPARPTRRRPPSVREFPQVGTWSRFNAHSLANLRERKPPGERRSQPTKLKSSTWIHPVNLSQIHCEGELGSDSYDTSPSASDFSRSTSVPKNDRVLTLL